LFSSQVLEHYEAARRMQSAVQPDQRIVTTLCPGGKERMLRLIETVRHGRVDLSPLLTHSFPLSHIEEAYALFSERRAGVIKVAMRP
jgi:alcohol dehydrogenase